MKDSISRITLDRRGPFAPDGTIAPPFTVSNPHVRQAMENPDAFWRRVRSLPGIGSWRILSDSVFLLSSFPLGLLWFIVAVVGFSLGLSLMVIFVGVPILALTLATLLWGAHFERSRLRAFLNVSIPTPYRDMSRSGNALKRAWSYARNPQLWRDIAYLLILFPLGIVELVIALLPWSYFVAPVVHALGGDYTLNGWHINTGFEAWLAPVVGVIVLVPLSILINLTATLHGELGKRFLGTSTEEILTERVEELTESRSAIMRAMYLERRRIERDLHDGAQQRLVNLAMELGRAREKLDTDPAAARRLIEESHEDAKAILTELRDLVRGIHPAVLSDRGLDAAISAIAGRSPIPVAVDVDLHDRQPDEVEGTAYFVVVEALTNVAKHSGATEANVSIKREGGWLRITVSDNGRGGADPEKGTGLRGLRDRIAALDGRFSLVSPPGKGTVLTVEIPCAS